MTVLFPLLLWLPSACVSVSPPTGSSHAVLQAGLLRVMEKGRFAPELVHSKLWPSRMNLRRPDRCVGTEEIGAEEISAWVEAITATINLLPFGEPEGPQVRLGNYLNTSFEPERSVVGERRYRETVDRAIAWWAENKAKF